MMIVARFLRHVVVMRRWTTHGGVLTHDRVVASRCRRRWRRRLWRSPRADRRSLPILQALAAAAAANGSK